jgi:uncharacterized membrane protein YeaQ/YmgE (transglycosylase-associated protein family)
MLNKLIGIVTAVGRWFAPSRRPFCVLIGLVVAAWILQIGYYAHPYGMPQSYWAVSVLIASCGVGFGFLVGSFASPGQSSEGAMFKVIAGLLLSFGSGFLLKHFDTDVRAANLIDILNHVRFWMFLASLLGGAISVYVFRAYYSSPSKSKQEIIEKAKKDLTRIQDELATLAAKETS